MKRNSYIGLTYGDPTGIGPEILLKIIKNWKYKFNPIIIGLKSCLIKRQKDDVKSVFFHTNESIQNTSSRYISGKPSKYSGKHAYECLKEAINLARNKQVIALVTGPVSKKYINLAGITFLGQTDEIAKICNTDPNKVIMLFVSNDLRIALFTRHIPLKTLNSKLNPRSLEEFILILNKEIKKWFGIKSPKIAVLGLNPHAGEGGLFGKEEKNIILPVIKSLQNKGVKVFGPLSPDATLAKAGQNYLKKKNQEYDVYVSLYHDQALPMFKAVCGFDGVNVTLGLPFLRVSVDHGTAFDIAGKGLADSKGLVSAIKLAEKLLVRDCKNRPAL